MPASRILSPASKLYLICDGETCAARGISANDFFRAAIDGGAKTIQYRHKNILADEYAVNLRQLLKFAAGTGVTVIVNDHADVAEQLQVPLHLGQDDPLPENLRTPYGRSTHSLAELKIALEAKPAPDYIALGTMFPSGTKKDVATNRGLVEQYIRLTDLPLVLIGGITLDNVAELPRSDRIFYAVIGDAFRFGATPDGIKKYVSIFAHDLNHGQ